MRIISRKTLREFWEGNPETEAQLKTWIRIVGANTWSSADDLKKSISNARPIGNKRVIFPILRNRFRLIVAIRFDTQIVYIRFIGTHAEYDALVDATKV